MYSGETDVYQGQILGRFDTAGVVRLAGGDRDACWWLCDNASR